jgi:hypothetical protein
MILSSSPACQCQSVAFRARNAPFNAKSVARGVLKIIPLLLLAVGFTSNVEAQPFANVPAPKLGPVSLGMSLEEVQAELPTANWRVEDRLPSGRPSRFAADDALEWAGDKASVTLVSTYYGRQILLIHLTKETNAQSCLERAKNWSIKLAETTGALVIGDPTGRYEEIHLGQGGVARLSAAQGNRHWPTQRWSSRPPTDFYYSAKPEFVPASNYESNASITARYSADGCSIELSMAQTTPQPTDIRQLPDVVQRTTLKPTIGRRHFLSSNLKTWIPPMWEGTVRNTDRSPRDILPEAVTAQVKCLINRHNGTARQCELATGQPTYPAGVVNSLTSLGASYQFDTSGLGLDIDDPAPLQVTLPITLSPADIKSTQFNLPNVPLEIPFRIPENLLARIIPNEAIDKELGAKMLVLCQIQIDQSVVCKIASFAETNSEKLAVLQRIYTASVLRVAHEVKICPDGCTTEPDVGSVFKIDFEFKLGQ